MTTPNKLSARYKQRRVSLLNSALIAFRMHRAQAAHYFELAGAAFIANEIVAVVNRHRHLKPDVEATIDAILSIHARQNQRTTPDAFWAATPQEIETLDLGMSIYAALLESTSGKHVIRAMRRVSASMEKRMKERENES